MLHQNIRVTVDALVFYKNAGDWELLLVKRKYDPCKGMWAFPGGFIDDNEDIGPAAIRELHEETGLLLKNIKQLHTFGKPGRDTRGRTISVVHYAIIENKQQVSGGDDAADAQWVSVKDIVHMAFDHKEILAFALSNIEELKR